MKKTRPATKAKASLADLTKLYSHLPKALVSKVVTLTDKFERIGPFELPIELPSGKVAIFTVYHYYFIGTKAHYYVLSQAKRFKNPLLRIESVCNYAHIFNSRRCDCRYQLMHALQQIDQDGDGLVIFCLDQSGKAIPGGTRGHALIYSLGQLQRQDLIYAAYVKNGFKEDYRDYRDVLEILKALDVKQVRLLTNNPKRIAFLKKSGLKVKRIPHEKDMDPGVSEELHFKKHRINHLLHCRGFKPEFLERYNLKPAK